MNRRNIVVSKIKQIGRHAVFIVCSNTMYGLILFFLTTWLAGYSLVYAYLGNLVLIVFGLMLDKWTLSIVEPGKLAREFENVKEKDRELNVRLVNYFMDSFVSFKTVLYLFYMIILIVSQIAVFNPGLVNEDIGNFLYVNQYNLVLLIAFDRFVDRFTKDRKDMAQTSAEFKKYLSKDQE